MDGNPYTSPTAVSQPPEDVVDRPQRDALAATLQRILQEERPSLELAQSIDPFRDSRDSAVRFVVRAIWLHYDDCDDGPAKLTKPAWNCFQRLLLLLESDRRVVTTRVRRWSATQPVALAALIAFLAIAHQVGWGYVSIVVAVPFGVVSIALSRMRRPVPETNPYLLLVYPFASLGDLRSAYDAVGFRKTPCPRTIRERRFPQAAMTWFGWLQYYAAWSVVSPAVLLAQALPVSETRALVVSDR